MFTKGMTKEFINAFSILLLCVVCICFSGCTKEFGEDGDNDKELETKNYNGYIQSVITDEYKYDEYGDHLELFYYNCNGKKEVEFPSEFSGKKVTVIKEGIELGDTSCLEKIVIPSTVKRLGCATRYKYHEKEKKLKELVIPSSIEEMDVSAFYDTLWYENLKDEFVIVGDGILVKYNGTDEIVKIPNGVKCISGFSNNSILSNRVIKIEMPESVKIICNDVFKYMTNLEEINIPDSVEKIRGIPFDGTKWLKNNKDEYIIVGNGVFLGWNNINFSEGEILKIPENVNYISSFFTHEESVDTHKQIRELHIPEKCVVDDYCIYFFSYYCSLIVKGDRIVKKDDTIYSGINKNYICSYFGERTNCKKIKLDDNVVGIGYCAFNSSRIEEIKLNDGIKYIGSGAFDNCHDLEEITIPGSVEKIGGGVLTGCHNLKKIVIEEGVEEIPEGFARDISGASLESIIIPESVNKIGEGAFLQVIKIEHDEKGFEFKEYGYSPNLIIYGKSGSYAEQFAKEKGIKFEILSES